MRDVNVDLININGSGTQAQGQFANEFVANGLSINSMKPYLGRDGRTYITVCMGDPKKMESYKAIPINANATLRKDEWKELDTAILEVSRERLGGVQDLIDKGLTYNLGNAMGTTMLEHHDISDFGEAELTMDGVSRHRNDRPNYQHNYLPIPIISMDYEINLRALEASRKLGNPVDVTTAERAARRVNEKLEDLLFTNVTYSFGEKDARNRNTIYSYLNHPDRNIMPIGTHWDDLNSNIGKTIVEQVNKMKQTSINARHYGPWMLYIPTNYETILDLDYDSTTPGTTIRERILKIAGISGIKVVDRMATDNVILVQMTKDVVRLVRGIPLQNVQWKSEGNFITNYKVMTIQVPQIRSDQNGKSGIVHLA